MIKCSLQIKLKGPQDLFYTGEVRQYIRIDKIIQEIEIDQIKKVFTFVNDADYSGKFSSGSISIIYEFLPNSEKATFIKEIKDNENYLFVIFAWGEIYEKFKEYELEITHVGDSEIKKKYLNFLIKKFSKNVNKVNEQLTQTIKNELDFHHNVNKAKMNTQSRK